MTGGQRETETFTFEAGDVALVSRRVLGDELEGLSERERRLLRSRVGRRCVVVSREVSDSDYWNVTFPSGLKFSGLSGRCLERPPARRSKAAAARPRRVS